MSQQLENYALIGDTQTAALVGRDGSIDWACFPRFDSGPCFAGLLGDARHGRWRIAPEGEVRHTRRRYLPDTLILETELAADGGVARLIDFMPIRGEAPDIVRLVVGVRGRVAFRTDLQLRGDDGRTPAIEYAADGARVFVAGPDSFCLRSSLPHSPESFSVSEGEQVSFVLTWFRTGTSAPRRVDPTKALQETVDWWKQWSSRSTYRGDWPDAVHRSLAVLKAMTYGPSGGVMAAPTASLPESLGGSRNWDYRFCWLRDSALTLNALTLAGYEVEAARWRDWLLRTVDPAGRHLRVLYSPGGEDPPEEREARWLPGYEGSRPVRFGNSAARQSQLDVYGELMNALHLARHHGLKPEEPALELQRGIVDAVIERWERPDSGIWEMRGEPRPFTHSKVMCWVALDRAIRAADRFGLEGPVDRWRDLRARIHEEVCRRGYDETRNTFTQVLGGHAVDASLLRLPLVGFLPATDPRMAGTVAAIERELTEDGLVYRYGPDADGLSGGEGAFLACSFWLVDNYVLAGRMREARALFERLLALRNDVGLLSEQYDLRTRRLIGNFPQGFSHLGLVSSAFALATGGRTIRAPND